MKVARFEDEHPHKKTIVSNSMSQDYIFGLSHGFERPCQDHQHQSQIAGLEDDTGAGMLSEMFNFPIGSGHQHNNPSSSSSTFHILLPNTVPNQQLSWVPPGGLSLSLSSTLQHLEGAKLEELRIGDDPETGMLYFNQGGDPYVQNMELEGGVMSPTRRPINIGYGSSSLDVVKLLRSSRYVKAAQDLLEELCSVGRGESKMNKYSKSNQNPSNSDDGSSSFKDLGPLSSAERIEHQRRKSKLLAMLDEVDRRYNRYCEQMQIVVNSFDSVLGFGAAVPYTALAQKAMSRHFRCLKDAIVAQLKHTCGLLGEKDVGSYGVTKGETPRLKLLDQSLRQQRAFHHMGVMEPEAWRPQRGLPERSVNILRAWLFEHFLHPYPSDADKHMLARQTGLSRNQVSNWFINARVRLWKPMVEDMYQQESKEEEAENNNNSPPPPPPPPPPPHHHHHHHHHQQDQDQEHEDKENPKYQNNYKNKMNNNKSAQIITTITTPTATHAKISEINESETENDPSLFAMNAEYCFSEIQAFSYSGISNTTGGSTTEPAYDGDSCQRSSMLGAEYRTTTGDDAADMIGSRLITFGTTSGDVSLTLGLHHTGNLDKPSFFS